MTELASHSSLAAPWPQQPRDQVRVLRRELGLSCAEFGARLGLSRGKISEIENGKYDPTPDTALAIERLSAVDGRPRIDAASLNDVIARARATAVEEGWCASDHAPLSTEGATGS